MRTSTKILIYLAVWKRPEITEICFLGIERLRRSYFIDALAVISEESMIPLCEKYNIQWVMASNEWLGKKKNAGLQKAKDIEFDYLMEIGSDDIILDALLEDYFDNYIGKRGGDFFGITDCAWINADTGECRRITSNTTYGAGRMIKRSALEKMNWRLWTDHINRGLDNNSLFNMARNGVFYNKVVPIEFPCVIDIKTDVNITPFNWLVGTEYDAEILLNKLSEEEIKGIRNVTSN